MLIRNKVPEVLSLAEMHFVEILSVFIEGSPSAVVLLVVVLLLLFLVYGRTVVLLSTFSGWIPAETNIAPIVYGQIQNLLHDCSSISPTHFKLLSME